MQTHDIGLAEQLLQRDILDPERLAVRIWKGIKGENAASKPVHDPAEDLPDVSRPHNAHRFAVEIESLQPAQFKIPLPHPIVRFVDAAVQGQNQSHGVLRNRIWRIGRNPNDLEAVLCCGGEIHVVEASTAQGNKPHAIARQISNRFFAQFIVHEDTDRVSIFGKTTGMRPQTGFMKVEFMISGGVGGLKSAPIVRLGAEYGDFHGELQKTGNKRRGLTGI